MSYDRVQGAPSGHPIMPAVILTPTTLWGLPSIEGRPGLPDGEPVSVP